MPRIVRRVLDGRVRRLSAYGWCPASNMSHWPRLGRSQAPVLMQRLRHSRFGARLGGTDPLKL